MKRFKVFVEQMVGSKCSCCGNMIDKEGKCGCGADCPHCGGQHNTNEDVKLDEAMDQKKFSAGAKSMKAYAQKYGGVDKKDFMEVSKLLDQIGRVNILQAGQLLTRLNRLVDGMDTDVRERMFIELKKVGLVESFEALDEISKKTLGSYVKKASDDRAQNALNVGKSGKMNFKGLKRSAGIRKAVNRLTKEEMSEAKTDAYHKHMLKALGKTRLPKNHQYTSMIANNGDFVVKDGGGRTVGRIPKDEHDLKK